MTPQEVEQQIRCTLLEFQIGDMRRALDQARANFLVAIGLMVATEYLGGLLTGGLGVRGSSRKNFGAGFKDLGLNYRTLWDQHSGTIMDVYDNIRCGLIHQYLPRRASSVTAGYTQEPGIVQRNGEFEILPGNYLRDLETATHILLKNIANDANLLRRCKKALSRIPNLA
jgi:hypothetical protein